MVCTIFRLEKYKFYRLDEEDQEPVEDSIPLGYYTNTKKLNEIIQSCLDHGMKKDDLRITNFKVNLRKNQKYIYELNYSYTVFLDPEKEYYVDYDYVFEPKSNRRDCMKLKLELLQNKKYEKTSEKIYSTNSDDGFTIEKYELNEMYNYLVVFNNS